MWKKPIEAYLEIFNFLRILFDKYFFSNHLSLGGEFIVCQVDVSFYILNLKNHDCCSTENEMSVLYIADNSYTPAKIYLELVENQKTETLLPIIAEFFVKKVWWILMNGCHKWNTHVNIKYSAVKITIYSSTPIQRYKTIYWTYCS